MTDKAIDPRYEFARAAEEFLLEDILPPAGEYLNKTRSGYGMSLAHLAAHHGRLPLNFGDWGLRDRFGSTVIHTLIRAGFNPPDSFQSWAIEEVESGTVAHLMISMGKQLPHDFDNWMMRDRRGRTVAHEAAIKNADLLPVDFDDWRSVDDTTGLTVAHMVVAHNAHFPPRRFLHWDMDVWKVEDRSSDWTVAHEAAYRGVLTKKRLRKLLGEDNAAIEGLLNLESVIGTEQPVTVRSLIKERKMLLKTSESRGKKTLTSILKNKK